MQIFWVLRRTVDLETAKHRHSVAIRVELRLKTHGGQLPVTEFAF